MKKMIAAALAGLILLFSLSGCGGQPQKQEPPQEAAQEAPQEAESGYPGIDVDSPEWVGNLEAVQDADQVLIVAAYGQESVGCWVSLHEKKDDGSWHMVMTTPGVLGRSGIGKTKEGDGKTPQGVYHFNRAFGIADDPGCAIPYVKVDDDYYWSGDWNDGGHYNELISTKEYPDVDVSEDVSEHIMDYPYHYQYCLNISYNEEGVPGLGSGLFLHCFGPARPFTAGCVAIPEEYMKYVMQHVTEETVVVIETYETLAGGESWPSSTWPQERPAGK